MTSDAGNKRRERFTKNRSAQLRNVNLTEPKKWIQRILFLDIEKLRFGLNVPTQLGPS